MIPIRDHNPSGKTPIVTYLLISINVLIFGWTLFFSPDQLTNFFNKFALVPAEIIQGKGWYTVFTSMFIHGSLGHLLGNMIFLNIFGDNLEDILGHFKYLVYYFVFGFGAISCQVLANTDTTVPLIGASGAIAGLMGGYLLLFPHHEIEVLFSFGFWWRRATVPAFMMLFYWLLAQVFFGVGSLASTGQLTGGIAYFAHLGGFVLGLLLMLPYKHRALS